MNPGQRRIASMAGVGIALGIAVLPCKGRAAEAPPSFTRDVAPILVEHCLQCHGPEAAKGRYRIDTYARVFEAGESGRVPVVPAKPEASELHRLLVTSDDADRMPRKAAPLPAARLELVRRWIEGGARFDGADPTASLAGTATDRPLPRPPEAYPHPVPVTAMAWIGTNLIATSGFREMTLWMPAGALARRIQGLPERLHALLPDPDGRRLWFAGGVPGSSGVAGVVEIQDGGRPRFFGHGSDVMLALAASPDGRRVALGGIGRDVAVFDGGTFARVATLTGHSDWILGLAFHPGGTRVVSASRDRTARVFDAGTGQLVSVFRDHAQPVTDVRFVENGQRVVSAGRDGRLRLWQADDARSVQVSPPMGSEPTCLATLGDRVWSGWADGRVREHALRDLRPGREWGPGPDRVLALALVVDGPRTNLAASHHDGSIRVWNLDGPSREPLHGFVAAPRTVDRSR